MILEFLQTIFSKLLFFTGRISESNSFPKPLTKEQEEEYLKKMKQGDENAKEILIKHNLRLVAHVVKKYAGSADKDDLLSVGSIGLIKAINTYEIGKGTQLATYTARCIENEILMLFRANKKFKNDISFNDVVGQDKEGNSLTLMDLISQKEEDTVTDIEKKLEKEKFNEKIKSILNEREYKIISMRYGLNNGKTYAQREVAAMLNISRSYISRIEKKAIEKLKKHIKKGDFYC